MFDKKYLDETDQYYLKYFYHTDWFQRRPLYVKIEFALTRHSFRIEKKFLN